MQMKNLFLMVQRYNAAMKHGKKFNKTFKLLCEMVTMLFNKRLLNVILLILT